jgi:phosphomannomutase
MRSVPCWGEQAAHQTRLEPSDKPGVLANSIVSSRLLGRIAAEYGLDHAETLTGFKWIARVDNLAYGYEEAIGYCVAPNIVRDKGWPVHGSRPREPCRSNKGCWPHSD